MIKSSRNNGAECFPEYGNSEKLPRSIPLEEIESVIDDHYESILERLKELFTSTSQAVTLQKNRGRLSTLVDEIKKGLGIAIDGQHVNDIATYGDLRRTGKKVRKIIADSRKGHPKFKDRHLDPTIGHLAEEACKEISQQYILEAAQLAGIPPPEHPDTPPTEPLEISVKSRKAGIADKTKKAEKTVTVLEPQENNRKVQKERDAKVLAVVNGGTELHEGVFPQPLHGYWDLDAFAETKGSHSYEDEIPSWIRELSEAETNRLAILLSESENGKSRKVQLDEFFCCTKSAYATDVLRREKLIKRILHSIGNTMSCLNKWLRRHTYDGLPEESGTYIHKPSVLRMQEQKQLMKPNLRRIVEHHFGHLDIPPAKRRLIDIGTWDGEMPMALRHQFGNMIGIEPNEQHFEQLCNNPTPHLRAINADMQTILANPKKYDLKGDTIIFSHVLYFLQQEDFATDALQWAHQHLNNNGMIVIILNDAEPEPASRAHMRRCFGVRESSGAPSHYKNFFEQQGIAVRTMRPSLHIKAHTDEGKLAMRDIMRFVLPGETRHDHAKLDEYQRLVDRHNGVLKHTLNILVAYKNAETAPCQAVPVQTTLPSALEKTSQEHSIAFLGSIRTTTKVSNLPRATPPHAPVVCQKITMDEWGAAQNNPAQLLALFDMIDSIAWQGEHKVKEMLPVELSYQTYRSCMLGRSNIEWTARALAQLQEKDTIIFDNGSQKKGIMWHIIFAYVHNQIRNEIDRGESVFKSDELETAFEMKLRDLQLWDIFEECRPKLPPTWMKVDGNITNAAGRQSDQEEEKEKFRENEVVHVGGSEEEEIIVFSKDDTDETFIVETNAPSKNFVESTNETVEEDSAVKNALEQLWTDGIIVCSQKQKKDPSFWNTIFSHIRTKVERDIANGDTVFDPDELDVAFEMQLRDFKLWDQYNGNPIVHRVKKKIPQTPELDKKLPLESGQNPPLRPREPRLWFGNSEQAAMNTPLTWTNAFMLPDEMKDENERQLMHRADIRVAEEKP